MCSRRSAWTSGTASFARERVGVFWSGYVPHGPDGGTTVLLSEVSSMRVLRTTIVAIAILAAAVLAGGCTGTTSQYKSPTPSSGAATTQPSAAVTATAASDVQVCAECAGKGMPAKVRGTATVKDGIQVVDVAIVNGTYEPNVITAQAGLPTQVVFAGKAKGCLAKPTFKSLGKSGSVTATGSATIDLGTLKPGVYKFTCSMGMNAATITVQ